MNPFCMRSPCRENARARHRDVLDAVTGMGEDLYSCGEWAFDIDREKAEAYASEHGIDLDAENLDGWGTDLVRVTANAVRQWHEGQVDKVRVPYFEHCRRVSRALDDEDGQLVGLLHDVIEDTGVTEERLRELVFSDVVVVDAVVALTRVEKEDPDDYYYRRVRANPLALRVKLADLRDNLNPARLAFIVDKETRERLKAKYAHALEALGQ